MEWPAPGNLASGVINGHAIHLGAQTLTATNTNAQLVDKDERQPVLNLEGTWTAPNHNNMVLTNGETPFEYHLNIPVVNPGDPVISGFVKVDKVMPETGKAIYECVNQKVFLYLTQDGTTTTRPFEPRRFDAFINKETGILHISMWLNGQQVDWSPADQAKVKTPCKWFP